MNSEIIVILPGKDRWRKKKRELVHHGPFTYGTPPMCRVVAITTYFHQCKVDGLGYVSGIV